MSTWCTTSAEKPRPARKRACLPRSWSDRGSLPNFFFHTAAAYAILRHNGVGIGKRNFLGDMPYREAA